MISTTVAISTPDGLELPIFGASGLQQVVALAARVRISLRRRRRSSGRSRVAPAGVLGGCRRIQHGDQRVPVGEIDRALVVRLDRKRPRRRPTRGLPRPPAPPVRRVESLSALGAPRIQDHDRAGGPAGLVEVGGLAPVERTPRTRCLWHAELLVTDGPRTGRVAPTRASSTQTVTTRLVAEGEPWPSRQSGASLKLKRTVEVVRTLHWSVPERWSRRGSRPLAVARKIPATPVHPGHPGRRPGQHPPRGRARADRAWSRRPTGVRVLSRIRRRAAGS